MKTPSKHLPNILSWLRLPLALGFYAVFLQVQQWQFAVLSLLLLGLAGLTDFFDGRIARKHNIVSKSGKWLDPFSDFIFFFFVYLGLFQQQLIPVIILILFSAREILMYTLIRPLLELRRLDAGAKLPGKIKTLSNFFVSLLLTPLSYFYFQFPAEWQFFPVLTTVLYSIITTISISSLYWYILPLLTKKSPK